MSDTTTEGAEMPMTRTLAEAVEDGAYEVQEAAAVLDALDAVHVGPMLAGADLELDLRIDDVIDRIESAQRRLEDAVAFFEEARDM